MLMWLVRRVRVYMYVCACVCGLVGYMDMASVATSL